MMTTTDVTTSTGLSHERAMALQAVELERTIALLEQLDAADWQAPTDCPDWDVRRMELHVLGACDGAASVRENLHQMRAAKRHQKIHGGPLEAGLSAVQVAEREDLDPAALLERLRAVAPVAVAKRTSLPSLLRRARMQVDGPVVERWSLGYLVDTIYLRDLWMHRVDVARATGRELHLTAEHDGAIVADVVAELARRDDRPFELVLTGPAGGSYRSLGRGDQAAAPLQRLELDAVELCRILAGRAEGEGVTTTIVPF